MTNLSSLSPAYITADATAAATDIITPKTAYGSAGKLTGTALDPSTRTAVASDLAIGKTAISVGGALTGTGVYSPAMMEFDGSTGYYTKTTGFTYSGNKLTGVCRFKIPSFTGGGSCRILNLDDGAGHFRLIVQGRSSDITGATNQNKLAVYITNTTGTAICYLLSINTFMDDISHTCFISYDGDAGLSTFIVDGNDEDDTGFASRVLTTGTLPTATPKATIGSQTGGGASSVNGNIGYVGHRDAYLTNWSDFMYSNGRPKALDTIGWTEWNAGVSQTPMMTFNGSTGYYNKTSLTTSGNKVTVVARFKHPSFLTATTVARYIVDIRGANNRFRPSFVMQPSDAAAELQQKVIVYARNAAGTDLCKLLSTVVVTDDIEHLLFFSFDGDSGLATFIIDGLNADDTGYSARVAPTTGTLDSGTGEALVGTNQSPAAGRYFDGDIGFFGYREAYLTNWSDFMEADGTPKEIDEIGWSQWGGQPLFWNKGGLMTDNAGSAGAMTKNGTITGPSGGWPLFWNEAGDMVNNLGSAGAMTKNGTINVGKGGNYV